MKSGSNTRLIQAYTKDMRKHGGMVNWPKIQTSKKRRNLNFDSLFLVLIIN